MHDETEQRHAGAQVDLVDGGGDHPEDDEVDVGAAYAGDSEGSAEAIGRATPPGASVAGPAADAEHGDSPEADSKHGDLPETGAEHGDFPEAGAGGNGLWQAGQAHDFRDQWRDLQLQFVDDPRSATGGAQHLIGRVIDDLAASATARKAEIDQWGEGSDLDTEQMRMAMHRYRELLDRLLDL